MKIAYIAAGAAGMYCGSCIRDNALVRELQKMGHEAILIPIYTPIRTDEESVSSQRVFYGAINVYLEQKIPFWNRLPGFMTRWLDHPRVLGLISGAAGSTDATGLGDLTLSVLRGEEGRQAAELEQLVKWLRDDFKPDVIQLPNSMLLGMARRIREELPDSILVCTLQGEDIFLDDLKEPWKTKVTEELRLRAHDVDLFLSTSQFYSETMAEFLAVDPSRVRHTRLGVTLDEPISAEAIEGPPWVIAYLARICPEKGLHNLVEAFSILSERMGPGAIRLRVAGYLGGRDKHYLAELKEKVDARGLSSHVDWLEEVDRAGKMDLLHTSHVFSVPTVYREPKGLSILEAMAAGLPVVQPAHGAFPEMLEETGGGLLVTPEDPVALADGLEKILSDEELRFSLGERAKAGVERAYSSFLMAQDTIASYEAAAGGRR